MVNTSRLFKGVLLILILLVLTCEIITVFMLMSIKDQTTTSLKKLEVFKYDDIFSLLKNKNDQTNERLIEKLLEENIQLREDYQKESNKK
jgi:uncharacterized membrane protein YgaE (UPF0421/DUF939 family)